MPTNNAIIITGQTSSGETKSLTFMGKNTIDGMMDIIEEEGIKEIKGIGLLNNEPEKNLKDAIVKNQYAFTPKRPIGRGVDAIIEA